ncbi:hypothetical protein [Bacillus nitratireducens]|uniref:hypothetical protein n=1 Tax=Bacillus nitratireducens TaxID=2026193 RepID=UPI0015CF08BF|nr:hypothetical protein [Bacillus nitratireducens]
MSKIQFDELPGFVQRKLRIMRSEIDLPSRKPYKRIDIWSYPADQIFPNNPEMQFFSIH